MKIIADINIPLVTELFSDIGDIEKISGRKISTEHVSDADILLLRSVTKVNEALLKNSHVQFVGTATIGVDHIDLDYLKHRDITFASAPGSNAISAAEYVISAIMTLMQKNDKSLSEQTVGIVGVGNVGGAVYERLNQLGVSCLLCDPPRQQQLADRDYVYMDTILKADIITAHIPLTKNVAHATYRLFDGDFFSALKQDAIFINSSRGDVVYEAALKNVLVQRNDIQLVLDVWQHEPGIDLDLLKRCQIGTSHIAGYSYDGKVRGTKMIYQALCQHLGISPKDNDVGKISRPKTISIDVADFATVDQALYNIVTTAYAVLSDDKKLRGLFEFKRETEGNKMAAYFDGLRKNYPVRQEFSNFTVELKHSNQELVEMLTALQFMLKSTS